MTDAGKGEASRFEYGQLLDTYHHYFTLVAKGISIYLLIVGACLTLPYTIQLDPEQQALFKEMCSMFAILVSFAGVIGYLVASKTFIDLHRRATKLADDLGFDKPNTWVMPFIVWLASGVAGILVVMIIRYA
jgi:hypothetical protein